MCASPAGRGVAHLLGVLDSARISGGSAFLAGCRRGILAAKPGLENKGYLRVVGSNSGGGAGCAGPHLAGWGPECGAGLVRVRVYVVAGLARA